MEQIIKTFQNLIIYLKVQYIKLLRILSKGLFLKWQYKNKTGRKLNLKDPKTFSEKLQWLKLHYNDPLYTVMVDKVLVKEYIERTIGNDYFVPLLGVWDKPEDIDFNTLPDKFVLKTNHNKMPRVIVCQDKKHFDRNAAINILNINLKDDFYRQSYEWPYKNVKRKVLAEKYLEEKDSNVLTDYKYFCFNGQAKFMYISKDGADEVYTDIFDMDFNHLPFIFKDKNAPITPSKPTKFEEMRSIAEKLSKDIPHLRVDFYLVDDQIYVGELTFFHNAGLFTTNPPEWDYKIGEMLDLSILKNQLRP